MRDGKVLCVMCQRAADAVCREDHPLYISASGVRQPDALFAVVLERIHKAETLLSSERCLTHDEKAAKETLAGVSALLRGSGSAEEKVHIAESRLLWADTLLGRRSGSAADSSWLTIRKARLLAQAALIMLRP